MTSMIRVLFFLLMGCTLHAQPEFDQVLDFEQIQDTLNEGRKENSPRKIALAWYHWAHYDEQHSGITDTAFQYFARSADRFLKAKDTLSYFRVRADVAERLARWGLLDEAIVIQEEVLNYAQKTQNLYLQTLVFRDCYETYKKKHDEASASYYWHLFSEQNKILGDTVFDIKIKIEAAKDLQKKQRYIEARTMAFRALTLAERKKHQEYIGRLNHYIGLLSYLKHDYPVAIQHLDIAEKLALRANVALRRDIYHEKAKTYAAIDSLSKAYYYATRYAEAGDTLLNRDKVASLQKLTLQYGSNNRIKDLEEQKKTSELRARDQKLTSWILGVALVVLLLAAYVFFRDLRHRLQSGRVIAAQNQKITQQKIKELEDSLSIENMRSMLSGQESERQRIAQDLHDSVGGLLAAIKIRLEGLSAKFPKVSLHQDYGKVTQLLDETVIETRNIARNMQPGTLTRFGLVAAIRDLVAQLSSDGQPLVTFQHFGTFDKIDKNTTLHCYRIIQELLQNSIKHAKATTILVQITQTEDQIDLLVEDDGVGYNPDTVQKGMGTGNMADRVQFLKGEINVQTEPTKGASVLVSIPL